MSLKSSALSLLIILFSLAPALAFKDVPKGHWAEPAVKKITEEYKIMSGYPNNTFVGGNTINRYEMAVMLSKLLTSFEQELDKDREDLASLLEVMELFQSEIKVLKDEIKKRDAKIAELNGFLDGFAGENQRLRDDLTLLKKDYDLRQQRKLENAKAKIEDKKKKKRGFWIFGRSKDKDEEHTNLPVSAGSGNIPGGTAAPPPPVAPPPAPPQFDYDY